MNLPAVAVAAAMPPVAKMLVLVVMVLGASNALEAWVLRR